MTLIARDLRGRARPGEDRVDSRTAREGLAAVVVDPAWVPDRKETLVRALARMIRGLTEYIPGPDAGSPRRRNTGDAEEAAGREGVPPTTKTRKE
jgi:hypothetical protein